MWPICQNKYVHWVYTQMLHKLRPICDLFYFSVLLLAVGSTNTLCSYSLEQQIQ